MVLRGVIGNLDCVDSVGLTSRDLEASCGLERKLSAIIFATGSCLWIYHGLSHEGEKSCKNYREVHDFGR